MRPRTRKEVRLSAIATIERNAHTVSPCLLLEESFVVSAQKQSRNKVGSEPSDVHKSLERHEHVNNTQLIT